ncbi:hypothetical protein ACP70R_036905 [Stipagrostis hirtigluma subsp. patula]
MQLIQTMRVMVALMVMVPIAVKFSSASSVFGKDPLCEIECPAKATSADVIVSLIGYVLSVGVLCFPGIRVSSTLANGHRNIGSERWFMAFLAIGTLDYVAWTGYSLKTCKYCDAGPFMIIISILGAIITSGLTVLGLVRDFGCIADGGHKWNLFAVFVFIGGMIGYGGNTYSSGPYALAGALVAQMCRVMATDYSKFSMPQIIVSIIGAISGLLCTRHPHLVGAEPFWLTSALVAGIRAVEFVVWTVVCWRERTRRQE